MRLRLIDAGKQIEKGNRFMCFCYWGMMMSDRAREARKESLARTIRRNYIFRFPWVGVVDADGNRSEDTTIFDDLPAAWKRKIYTPLNEAIENLLIGRDALGDRARCTAAIVDGKLAFTFDCKDAKVNAAVAKLAAPLMEKSAFVCQECGRKLKKQEDGSLLCPECD